MDLKESFHEEVEFTWRIENFHMYPQRPGEAIQSPLLAMGEPRHSIFCLKVYPKGMSEGLEHIVTADLVRLQGSFSGQLLYKVSIVAPNGELMEAQMSTNCRSILWIKKGDLEFFDNFLSNDTLTLRCRLTLQDLPPHYAADITVLSQNIGNLYESKAHSDLTLCTGDKEFLVHKFILRQRAPHFLKGLGLQIDNLEYERVNVSSISTPVLCTLIQYFYNGKLESLPSNSIPELLETAERYGINSPDFVELTKEVINLGSPIAIRTHINVTQKIINWSILEDSEVIGFDNRITQKIHFGSLCFLVQFYLLPEYMKGMSGNISFQCLSVLEKDIFMACKMYLGFKEPVDFKSQEYHQLKFSATGNGNEQHMPKYYYYWPLSYLNNQPSLQMQLAISVSDCEVTSSVDTLDFVSSKQPLQFGLSSLHYDMMSLFNKTQVDKSGDVELVFENKAISAHKAILAAWSPVFDGMFNCDMTEKQNDKVNILDVDHSTALRLIMYMYCGAVFKQSLTEDTKLYVAADKYQVVSLFRKCSSFLVSDLTMSNACDFLMMAYMHCDNKLMDSVEECIFYNQAILNSSEWELLSDNNPNLCSKVQQRVFLRLRGTLRPFF